MPPRAATRCRGLRLLQTGDDLAEHTARDALDHVQIIANVDPKTLERGVLELFRKAKADLEEGGSNTLFLALGSLRWRPPGETKWFYRAPLILLPVRLERKKRRLQVSYLTNHDDNRGVQHPPCSGVAAPGIRDSLPELAGELPADEGRHRRSKEVWRLVRERVRDTPEFEVVEELTLSTFSFAKYLMWKDLADRTEALKGSPFVRHLIENPRDPYVGGASFLPLREIDERIDPAELFAPLNADSSQVLAIHASGSNGDFVLEGPPGTGKSETIGNIIAHNLATGRKVLFVSEKMAALDVVYRRLCERGLGRFCLELHSSKANKRAVLDQLGAAWDERWRMRPTADWAKKANELRSVRTRLNGLVAALHTPGPAGISPRDAIGRAARWAGLHPVNLDWGNELERPDRAPTPQAMAAAIDCARRLGLAFSQVTAADRAAFAPVGHEDWSFAWATRVASAARAFNRSLGAMRQARANFARQAGLDDQDGLAATEGLGALAQVLPRCASGDVGFALGADGKDTLEAMAAAAVSLASYATAVKGLPAAVNRTALASAPTAAWMQARKEAAARMWPFRGRAQKNLRRQIEAHLAWPAAKTTESSLESLGAAQSRGAEAQRSLTDLPPGLTARGLETDPARLTALVEAGTCARAAMLAVTEAGGDLVTVRERMRRFLSDGRDLLEPGMPIPSAAATFAAALTDFLDCFAAFRNEAALASDVGVVGAFRGRPRPPSSLVRPA